MSDFLFGHTGVWIQDLWISSPDSNNVSWWLLVFTSDNFRYLTLLQRDLWWYSSDWTCERFSFWPQLGFEPVTSGSLVLHSTTAPRWLLVFTSYNFRYLTLVQRDWWWYCSDWTCERFSFWTHLWFKPGTYGSLVLHSTTVAWWLLVFYLWQFQAFNLGAEGFMVVLFWLDLWEIFFLATPGFEPGTSGSLVLHSTTAPWWLLVFTSDNFRYLTLVQRDWWWYCSDWTCESFLFGHTGVWTWDLWIASPALYHCPWWLLVFTSDNFRYLTLVQRD